MKITLDLDQDTIARLDEIGPRGRASSLGNEILGMALTDAYQQWKLDQKNKRAATIRTRKVPATTKRATFKGLVAFGKARGVSVQRRGKGVEFWRTGQEHTVGECQTIGEAWCEIESGAI